MLDILYLFWEIITGIGFKGPIWIGKQVEKVFSKSSKSTWEEQSHLAVGYIVFILVVGGTMYLIVEFKSNTP